MTKAFSITTSQSPEVDPEKAKDSSVENPKPSSVFGVRHLQCLQLFFCLTVAYALRVNLSVAIVAMTDKNATNPDFEEYQWDEKTKSLILSSFFWGYVVTQVPAGQMAQIFGAKILLFFGILICSLLNVLTPWCASVGGWQVICGLRLVQGLCQGVIFPSTHTLLSKWAPIEERGRLGTYCYSGSQFGTVIMLASSGIIASSVLGWPSIFYISGSAGILWSALWLLCGSDSPAKHKSISAEEKKFIETSLGQTENESKKRVATPWLQIFTSLPFISLILVHCAHNWGFWTLLTEMPTYMKSILGMDIKSNALLSSLPYLAMWILSYFFSFLADVLAKYQCISLSISRKLFNSIGHWVPMVALIALGYVTKAETSLAIGLLVLAVGINSATYLGYQVNHIDLAPNHAGTLMGITNCAANIMSIIAPLMVGVVVTNESDPNQWRIVFFIASAIYLLGNLLFVIFGKTDVQSWNSSDPGRDIKVRRESVIIEAVESHN